MKKMYSKFGYFFMACLIQVIGCTTKQDEVLVKPKTIPSQSLVEKMFPNQTGTIKRGFYLGYPIEYELFGNIAVFQSDIILDSALITSHTPTEKEINKNAKTESTGRSLGRWRWPNNTIYYTISSSLPNQSRVTSAISHWQANSNLTFVQRTNQKDYITFTSGSGCSSNVGMIGGQQFIYLSTACTTGNTIHEIGHAVGLWHEQSRTDRGNAIIVNLQNVLSGAENNFQTYAAQGQDGFNLGSFDFGSIMMYSSYDFSANGQPTITRLNGSTFSSQRTALSSGDQAGSNLMYPTHASGTSAFFRYYKSSSGNHFYTTNWAELESGKNGFVYEGSEGYVYGFQASGTGPIRRYYNTSNGDHLYTTLYQSYPGYTYEGIAGYAYGFQASGTIPVYRYYNTSNGDHFYTTNNQSYNGYVSEGIAWYAFP